MARQPEPQTRQDVEAERAVLSIMIADESYIERAERLVGPEDFDFTAHRRAFSMMTGMRARGEHVDMFTLVEPLSRVTEMAVAEAITFINGLVSTAPVFDQIDWYARKVLRASNLRRTERFGKSVAEFVQTAETDEAALDYAETAFERLKERARRADGPKVMTAPELMAASFPPPVWIVRDLLPVGVCLLAGPTKARKSFWALNVGMAVATGAPALGKLPVQKSKALCVFLEDRFPEVQERMAQFLGEEDAPPGLSIAQDCPRMDEGGEAWLSRYLKEHPDTRYVVLDPLMRVRGGRLRAQRGGGNAYADDYEDMEAFKRIVDRHEVCLLILHHCRKLAADDWVNALNGSTGLAGAADAIMLLQADRGSDEATFRATGRRVRNLQLMLRWEDHSGWNLLGDAQHYAQNRGQEAVMETLRQARGPLRLASLVATVCDATGENEGAVKKRIIRMADRDQIRREAGLYWAPGEFGTGDTGDSGDTGDIKENEGIENSESAVPSVPVSPDADFAHELYESHGDTSGDTSCPLSPNGAEPVPAIGDSGDSGDTQDTEDAQDNGDARDTQDAVRWRLRSLAGNLNFPALDLGEGNLIGSGEQEWSHVCRAWHPGLLVQAEAALHAMEGGSPFVD